MRHQKKMVQKGGGHRHSAPSLAFLNHSPVRDNLKLLNCARPSITGTFLDVSQPYSMQAVRHGAAGGRPTISVQKSVAHQIFASAYLKNECKRKHSFSNHSENTTGSQTAVPRSGSEPAKDRTTKDNVVPHRKIRANMLSSAGALSATESNDAEALSVILRKGEIKFHEMVEDAYFGDWSLLEVALMLGHHDCANILLQNGATIDVDSNPLNDRLRCINKQSMKVIEEIKRHRTSLSLSKEGWKNSQYLEKRLQQLKKMKTVVKHCILPGSPYDVEASVSGSDQVTVVWSVDERSNADPIINFKVEWSLCDDFKRIENSLLIKDIRENIAVIYGLKRGLRYSVRVLAASLRGYGHPTIATPNILLISSWEDVEDSLRCSASIDSALELLQDVDKYRSSPIWQTVFPKVCPDTSDRKKRGSLLSLFINNSKFIRVVQNGIHLVSIIYSDCKVWTIEEYLPMLVIDQNQSSVTKEDVHWAMKLSLCWDYLGYMQDSSDKLSPNSDFRQKFIETVFEMQSAAGIENIGRLHHQALVNDTNTASFLITIRFVENPLTLQGFGFRWITLGKLARKRTACSSIDGMLREVVKILNFYESSQIPLQKGLYLCYMKLHSSFDSISVVVPQNLPSVLPFAFIRSNSHVSKEEWEWLRSVDNNTNGIPTKSQMEFHISLLNAASQLLSDLDIDIDLVPNQRLYRIQLFQLKFDVSFILLLPKIEDVCSAPSCSPNSAADVHGCLRLPLQVFETIHLCTYRPKFLSTYCRLSIFIEHFTAIAQYQQRNSLLEKDARVYADFLTKLNEFQQRLEYTWRSMRWIGDVASTARSKRTNCMVPLARLFAVPGADDENLEESFKNLLKPPPNQLKDAASHEVPGPNRSASSGALTAGRDEMAHLQTRVQLTTGVIKVYAAYECGLSSGASVRLQIASTTSAREVVALVIEQLAKEAATLGDNNTVQTYRPENFCLAAVIGSRERCLCDDFSPLKLQNPWNEGRLYVRHRQNVLAALQHGNETVV